MYPIEKYGWENIGKIGKAYKYKKDESIIQFSFKGERIKIDKNNDFDAGISFEELLAIYETAIQLKKRKKINCSS